MLGLVKQGMLLYDFVNLICVSFIWLDPFTLQLFLKYDYTAHARPRFGVSLGLLVDCLNTFSVPGHSSMIELQYPGPDMQLLLK